MKKTKIILIAASAAMLLAGCMSREETELLSTWTVGRYTAQAMAVQKSTAWREEQDGIEIEAATEPASDPAPLMEQAKARLQEVEPEEAKSREAEPQQPLPVMKMVSSPAASQSTPTPAAKEESASAELTPIPRSEWPYITCPPEPTPIPQSEWPYITCPPEPSPTPQLEWPGSAAPSEPDPTPVSTAIPMEPDQTPAPVETPQAIPEPTPTPSGGYAVCSCGATLTPGELTPHMKAHALNGESHSYVAY